jgi:hypothetical protein
MTVADTCQNSGVGGFPDADWLDRLRDLYKGKSNSATVVLFGKPITLPPPVAIGLDNECSKLAGLVSLRTPERLPEICRQVWSSKLIEAFYPAITKSPALTDHDKLLLREIANYALAQTTDLLFQLKAFYNRARPWNCCGPAVLPVFTRAHGDFYYPGHPSYPSGHSTQAHTVAGIFSWIYSNSSAGLLAVADRIARNREIGGLHFESDSAAGKLIGAQFSAALLNAPQSLQTQEWLNFIKMVDQLKIKP